MSCQISAGVDKCLEVTSNELFFVVGYWAYQEEHGLLSSQLSDGCAGNMCCDFCHASFISTGASSSAGSLGLPSFCKTDTSGDQWASAEVRITFHASSMLCMCMRVKDLRHNVDVAPSKPLPVHLCSKVQRKCW